MTSQSTIQSCIDALTVNSNPFCFVCLAAQTRDASVGVVNSVSTPADLPCLAVKNIGPGQMFFVDCLGVPVVSSCNEWMGLDGRVLRRDYPQNTLWTWGLGACGALGTNGTVSRSSPVQEISCSTNWCQISLGGTTTSNHALGIKFDSTLWTWGANDCGQLGDRTIISRSSPIREITCSSTWCAISAITYSSSGIKSDGSLWGWGRNYCGMIGDNSKIDRSSPTREICSSCNWCKVASGIGQRAALKTDGSLWSWGSNAYGQIGDNTSIDRSRPTREISSSTTWCQIAISNGVQAGIKTDGGLWLWGCNASRNLLDNSTVNRSSPVQEVTSSTWSTIAGSVNTLGFSAIKQNGTLWSWGDNVCGRLGNNSVTDMFSSPVQEVSSGTTWCSVSASPLRRASALKTDGTLWSWGNNYRGVFGNNSTASTSSPVREISSGSTWCQVSGSDTATAAIKLIYQ